MVREILLSKGEVLDGSQTPGGLYVKDTVHQMEAHKRRPGVKSFHDNHFSRISAKRW
jgi:hypothetical protein